MPQHPLPGSHDNVVAQPMAHCCPWTLHETPTCTPGEQGGSPASNEPPSAQPGMHTCAHFICPPQLATATVMAASKKVRTPCPDDDEATFPRRPDVFDRSSIWPSGGPTIGPRCCPALCQGPVHPDTGGSSSPAIVSGRRLPSAGTSRPPGAQLPGDQSFRHPLRARRRTSRRRPASWPWCSRGSAACRAWCRSSRASRCGSRTTASGRHRGPWCTAGRRRWTTSTCFGRRPPDRIKPTPARCRGGVSRAARSQAQARGLAGPTSQPPPSPASSPATGRAASPCRPPSGPPLPGRRRAAPARGTRLARGRASAGRRR